MSELPASEACSSSGSQVSETRIATPARSPRLLCRVHSHYSLLEGVDSPEALVQRAAAGGYEALALTDVNNLYGAVAFVEAARKHGIRPILGARLIGEAATPRKTPPAATVLIAEPAGYASLCRIISRLHLRHQPDLIELLLENPAGLHLLVERADLALRLRPEFGKRLWLEIVRPTCGNSDPERVLLDLAARYNIKPVASVAVHFAVSEGYPSHRLVTAIRLGTLVDRLHRELPITPAHYLVDPETLRRRFCDLPEAVVNTQLLAAQCRSDVLPRGITLPPAKVPRSLTAFRYLELLCGRALSRPAAEQQMPTGESRYRERLAEELHVVNLRDLAGYFLVVRDIARYARRRGFSMALRGSAGNSLICYLLGITNVDPLRFDLPMERFLHAGRPDLPDIDLDFDWKVRDEVIAWAFERYGQEHTAMISSHLFLQPASAFREAGKVHGLSNEQISQLLEVWQRGGYSKWDGSSAEGWETKPADEAPSTISRRGSPPPPGFPLEPERWPRLLADAQRLIGRPHHLSIHPGGIVITPRPIEEYVPLQRAAKGVVITQLDKDPIEHIGLVKIDLLGNRALSTVDATRRSLRSPTAKRPSTVNRQEPLAVIRTGDTLGLNQLESPAMRHLLVQMQPRGVLDVIQSLALIRPGAASIGAKERFVRRRRGIEPTVFDHPKLEPLLGDTCGLMLYEDDALGVVQALAGFSAPEADHFRKRVTKTRDPEEAAALSRAFLQACERNGVDREAASKVWVQLAKFNEYSFCKSHAVSYGLIAWEAVRLKADHPVPFWCAALNNNQGMYPRRVYVEAIKQAGIDLRLPCVNRSEREFTLEPRRIFPQHPEHQTEDRELAIRTGLAAIHGLDESAWEAILADRRRRGPFADFHDFRRRVPLGGETLALLIQAGAFDFAACSRPKLLLEAEMAGRNLTPCRPRQPELFASSAAGHTIQASWSPSDYSQARCWKEEWERLGFLVGPPLMSLFRPHLPQGLPTSRDLHTLIGKQVCVAGLVATARHATTKHGETMAFMSLQDEWGFVDVTFFPGTFPAATYLGMGPYLVWGTVEEQYDVITVTAERFRKQDVAPWAGS